MKDVVCLVYEGNEKYIFVSYAHNDADTVLPIVDALMNDGYRVWFDSGIEAGTEWPEYIEDHLMNSHVVLVFMSPSAVESRNCRNEINFALELKKEILVIYLEDTTLLKGMRLQLNSTQSFFRKHHSSEETFIRELLNARILQDCRAVEGEHTMPVLQPKSAASGKSGKAKFSRWPVYAMLGAILAALVILICVIAFGGKGNTPKLPEGTEPVASAPLEMSDDLFDYVVEIEGSIYKFPCKYEDLTSQGWTISSTGYSNTSLVPGGGYESFHMSNNGKKILVSAYNMSGNAVQIQDCMIGGFEYDAYSGLDVKLAKGITVHSTPDEIVAAYGTPNQRSDQDDYVALTYSQGEDLHNRIRFTLYKSSEEAKYSFVTLENFVAQETDKTQTNTQRPDYLDDYRAPTQLGTDFKEGIVEVGGDLYRLPAPVSAFLDNGWQILEQPSFVKAGNNDTVCLGRDGGELYLTVVNLADYQTTAENCVVCGMRIEEMDEVDIQLPNGMRFGLTKQEVAALVTDEFYFYEGSYNDSWSYSEYSGRELYLEIQVSVETQKVESISISCDIWDY